MYYFILPAAVYCACLSVWPACFVFCFFLHMRRRKLGSSCCCYNSISVKVKFAASCVQLILVFMEEIVFPHIASINTFILIYLYPFMSSI